MLKTSAFWLGGLYLVIAGVMATASSAHAQLLDPEKLRPLSEILSKDLKDELSLQSLAVRPQQGQSWAYCDFYRALSEKLGAPYREVVIAQGCGPANTIAALPPNERKPPPVEGGTENVELPKPVEPPNPTTVQPMQEPAGEKCMSSDAIAKFPDPDFTRNLRALQDPSLCVQVIGVQEGKLSWKIETIDSGRSGPLWAVPHDNENSAFDTAVFAVRQYGGVVVAVEAGEQRNFEGQDPNRNFGRPQAGGACPGQKYGPAPKYTNAFMSRLRTDVIVALHSNDPGSNNININHPHNGDTAFPATQPFGNAPWSPKMIVYLAGLTPPGDPANRARIAALHARNLNVMYEHVSAARNDCSMSNFIALTRPDIRYFNIEVPHGDVEAQKAMTRIVMDVLAHPEAPVDTVEILPRAQPVKAPTPAGKAKSRAQAKPAPSLEEPVVPPAAVPVPSPPPGADAAGNN